MKKTHHPRISTVAAVVASALSFGAIASDFTAVPMDIGPSVVTQYKKEKPSALEAALEQQFPTYYIIQLEDAPLATYNGGVKGFAPTEKSASETKLALNSVQSQAYGRYLSTKQREVLGALQSKFPQLQVERSLQITLNGFIVTHPGKVDIKKQLSAIPGVKKVFEHEIYEAQMDASNTLIKTQSAWDLLGNPSVAGKGVKVAIIDGGINADHPMFAANGHERPAGLPQTDYCATIDESFCNDKLVIARYYTPTFAVHPSEHISPRDFGGHGTHVAGTAVGNQISGTYEDAPVTLSGVAPGATLMVYKALFQTPAGRGSGSNMMLVGALEDAVADGADVINNSWGGGAGGNPADSVYTPIFTAAEAAGVMIVTAAGNDGPGATTVGCPGCIEAGITVASTQTGRTFGAEVTAPGLEEAAHALPGAGDFKLTAEIKDTLLLPSAIAAANNLEGCSAFPADTFKDKIAMIPRGTCAFSDKANNAQAAGAKALIVYNNAAGVISMSMPGVTLPSVSITQADGALILDAWEEGSTATISAIKQLMNPANVDAMSDFSSRGPNGDSSFLKPEIAAPGSDILSASAVPGDVFNINSGTSMASPHVAGAAALLRQQRPELDAFQIKSILMTSSNPAVKKEDATTEATPFDRGAGRLDIEAATKTAVAFDQASIVSNGCAVTCTFERVITNLMPEDGEWEGVVEFSNSDVTGEISTPTVALDANGSASFVLTVNVAYADAGWQFGQVVWTDKSGKYAQAHLPIAVMARQSDNSQLASTMLISDAIKGGTPFEMQSSGGHTGATEYVNFTVRIPEQATIDPASVSLTETRANRTGFSIAPNGRTMAWAGSMSGTAASATLTNATFLGQGVSLAQFQSTAALPCENVCDEVRYTFNVGNFGGFTYNGQQVSTITISDNGFIAAANQSTTGSWLNQQLPNVSTPNAVIAPLWSDYAVGGAYGGNILYNVLNDGQNDWFAIEWNNVQEYDSPTGNRYTFAVWIKLGTDEVYLNYLTVPALPAAATVGIEDITGTLGTSYYYNGQGSAPTAGQALRARLTSATAAKVTVDYELTAPFGQAEAITTEVTHGESVRLNLAGKFETSSTLLSHVTTSSTAGTYNAAVPLHITSVDGYTAKVVTEPTYGTVTVVTETSAEGEEAGLVLVYTPTEVTPTEENPLPTTDSFTYQIEDAEGATSSTATVSVTLKAPNVAPVAAASASASRANVGETVTLSASGSTDANDDALSYTWTQTSGPSVTLTNANAVSATFKAPALGADTTLAFTVTVSDGQLSSTATTSVVVVAEPKKKSSGSFGFLITLLALPLALLRRRQRA